jgi:3-hydroxy-D-aspartate aldolase
MDLDYLHVQPQEFELSLTVLATVLGRYDDRLVVDAGTKTLSTDAGFAKVMGYEHLNYRPAGDEHGILAGDLAGVPLAAGDSIEFIPSHCDTTANLHDLYFVTVAGTVVDVWPIVARGCVR